MSFTLNSLLLKSNKYTYEYFLQSDVCRLCWTKNAFRELTSKMSETNRLELEVSDILQDCLDIDLTDSGFPKRVCDNCWDFVKKFHSFKKFCKESDRKLRDIFSQHSAPVEIVIKEEVEDSQATECNVKIIDDSENTAAESKADIPVWTRPKRIGRRRNPAKPKFTSIRLPHYCYRCFKGFEDPKQFVEHKSEYHGIVNGLYKCFGCDKLFESSRRRSTHETQGKCDGLNAGYKCPQCGGFLPTRTLYEMHMRQHSRKKDGMPDVRTENIFQCKMCDMSFNSKEDILKHKTVHARAKSYVCETCGALFRRPDYLRKHAMIHTGVKQNVCTYCGGSFTQKSSLNVHLRKHTGERPFSCDVCPQRCVSSSNLRAHRQRHQGLKHFECAICGRRFGYKLSLAEHIASSHAPAEKHECPLCGASYTRGKVLRRHLALKHGAGAACGAAGAGGGDTATADHVKLPAPGADGFVVEH